MLNKLKKWILGLFATGVIAVSLGATNAPENTTYRLYWDEAFDYIQCAQTHSNLTERADCNEQAYLESAKNHIYPNAVGARDLQKGIYFMTEYVELTARTSKEAKDYFKNNHGGILPGAKLEAKTLLGNYVEIELSAKLYYEKEGMIFVAPISFLRNLLLNQAYAVFPSDNFESYGTGDLNGGAGGTGWSANWVCGTDFDVVSTPVQSGSRAVQTVATANDHTCRRTFTANSTNDQVFSLYQQRSASAADNWNGALDDSALTVHTIWQFATDNNIKIYNNLTLTNVGTFIDGGAFQKIELKINYTNDTNAIAIDGGAFSTAYTMYNAANAADTGRYRMDYNPHTDGTIGIDDIADTTVVPAVGGPARNKPSQWFLLF